MAVLFQDGGLYFAQTRLTRGLLAYVFVYIWVTARPVAHDGSPKDPRSKSFICSLDGVG